MSSISRRRNGLMALSVIGGLLSWVRLKAPQSQDKTPASGYSTCCHQLPRERFSPMPLTGHLRHLSNKLLELRKRAKAQPGLKIRLKLSVSSDDQRAGAFGLSNSSIAHPNLGHCPQIGDKIKIDIKARIYRA